jgi:hypothetical protein
MAQVWGRVNKTELSILIDSGSSISVCSNDFAQNHFCECRKIAYKGPSVTVANNDTVRPLGMVLVQTVIGPSATIVPFVIFPELPVDCLLGTDWLHNSGAITHWGKQVLLFEDSKIETSIRVIAAYSAARLHLVKTLTIPAQTGMWAEVTAPLQHGMARLPRACVIMDLDPWCASHTGVLCTRAIQNLCNGGTKVFLVNSTTLPMQLQRDSPVAVALPDAPTDDQVKLVDGDAHYSLNPDFRIRDISDDDACARQAITRRMVAVATALGMDPAVLSEDEILQIMKASALSVTELAQMRTARAQTLVAGPTPPHTWFSSIARCLFMGSPEPASAAEKDPKSQELYTSKEIVDAVRSYLGDIQLDPASCARANWTVKAEQFFVKGQ